MAIQIHPFSILLIVTALLANAVVLYIKYKINDQRSKIAVLLMFSITIWMVGAALELASITQEVMSFWMQVQFTGICTAPIIWLAYTFVHTNQLSRSAIRKLMLFSIPTVFSLAIVYTNEFHGLIFPQISMKQFGSYVIGAYNFGIGFWLIIGYTFLIHFVAIHTLLRAHFLARRVFRWELFALMTAFFIPLAIFIFVDRFGQMPHLGVRISPLAFGITVPLATLLMNKLHTLDLMPFARDIILENIGDVVIVTDRDNRIIDINRTAKKLFAPDGKQLIGVNIEEIGVTLLASIIDSHKKGNTQPQLTLNFGDPQNHYKYKITSVTDKQGNYLASIIFLYDVTEIKQQNLVLSSLLEAATAISSELNLNDVLTQIAKQMCTAVDATSAYICEFNSKLGTSTVVAEFFGDAASEKEKISDLGNAYEGVEPDFIKQLEISKFAYSHIDDEAIDAEDLALMQQYDVQSILYILLSVQDRSVGYVEIYESRYRREYTKDEIVLCQTISNNAAIALENARLHQSTQKHLAEQTILREAGSAISSALDFDAVLKQIAEQMCSAINGTSAYICNFDAENNLTSVLAEYFSKEACEAEKKSDLGSSYNEFIEMETEFMELLREGLHDISQIDDEGITQFDRKHMQEFGAKSILYIPLKVKNELIGYVEIWESRQKRDFTEAEISLCKSISYHAAAALENSRLFYETQQRLHEQTILREAGMAISSALDFKVVLTQIAEQMCVAVKATSAYICDFDPKQETSTVLAEFISDSANEIEKTSDLGTSYDESSEVEVEFLERLTKGLHDYSHINDDEISDVEREHMEAYGVKSILYIPLMIKNRPIGFVEIWESREKRTFTDDEISLCQTIAQQAAIALDNAHLFENAQNEINERKRIEERLFFDATHDNLTGLSNRKVFLERLGQVCKQPASAQARYFAVLFLDFDRFKVVNDSLGHARGDQLLIESARRIQECLRPTDLLSRLGGDEFVILLEDIASLEYATRIADRIQKVITKPFIIEEREVYISTSIGILFDRAANQRAENLIRDADIAMYQAKEEGKARYAIFAPELRSAAMTRLEMETALRHAIDNQELTVYYQPIFSLQNDRLLGFEALVRWRNPEQGMIAPGKFIPLAEETGLIVQIDSWVLREACKQIVAWQGEYPQTLPLTISVNMSGQTLSRPGLVENVQSILQTCGLPPEQLHLEITESTIMQYAHSTVILLNNLQRLGVKLHIDDFGTGYSSLSYLHRFPLDAIKIDRSFVSNMQENEMSSGLVSTIIKLAHTLKMTVIAEGVETDDQKSFLNSMQCEQAQGFFLAKPMDKTSIENQYFQR